LIQEVLETIKKTGLNVRTFAGQMTEYIVSNIETALAKKQFPLYKSVFDRFTRIYVESRQISVPMDVLTMSLCECIIKNSDAIKYTMQEQNTVLKTEEKEITAVEKIPEIITEEPEMEVVKKDEIITEPEIISVAEISEPEPVISEFKKQEESPSPAIIPDTSSIAEIFIQKILE
jgi:hypothetical protein